MVSVTTVGLALLFAPGCRPPVPPPQNSRKPPQCCSWLPGMSATCSVALSPSSGRCSGRRTTSVLGKDVVRLSNVAVRALQHYHQAGILTRSRDEKRLLNAQGPSMPRAPRSVHAATSNRNACPDSADDVFLVRSA